MPAVGDTQVRFTRSYIFIDPKEGGSLEMRSVKNTNGSVGTWRLAIDDEYLGDGDNIPSEGSGTVGTARVAASAAPTKIGQLLYMTTVGEVAQAIANDVEKSSVVGVALEEVAVGETVSYGTNVIVDVFDTASVVENDIGGVFAPSVDYYLSANEAGKWTYEPDTTTVGNYLVLCGKAVGVNQMLVEVQARTEI